MPVGCRTYDGCYNFRPSRARPTCSRRIFRRWPRRSSPRSPPTCPSTRGRWRAGRGAVRRGVDERAGGVRRALARGRGRRAARSPPTSAGARSARAARWTRCCRAYRTGARVAWRRLAALGLEAGLAPETLVAARRGDLRLRRRALGRVGRGLRARAGRARRRAGAPPPRAGRAARRDAGAGRRERSPRPRRPRTGACRRRSSSAVVARAGAARRALAAAAAPSPRGAPTRPRPPPAGAARRRAARDRRGARAARSSPGPARELARRARRARRRDRAGASRSPTPRGRSGSPARRSRSPRSAGSRRRSPSTRTASSCCGARSRRSSPSSRPSGSRRWPARRPNSRARLEATLLAWLRHAGHASPTRRSELGVHPQTVRYRLGRLRELFGAALDEPDARFELELVLRAARHDRRRHREAAVAERAAALAPGPGGLLKIEGGVARRAMRDRRRAHARRGGVARRRGPPARARRHRGRRARALERMRFVLALDDDLEPFHRAHRADPLLGRIIKARPKLRVLRKPEPFEALAWAIIEQLIDTQRGRATSRGRSRAATARGTRPARGARRPPDALANAARARGRRARAHAVAHARARRARRRARPDRPGADDQRRLDAIPGIGEWTLAHLEPVRPRPLRRAAGQGRRHAQRLRADRRRAHRQRHRGRVRRRSSTASGRGRASRRCTWSRRDGEAGRVGHNHRMPYVAAEDRYDSMPYRRCGRSGIKLPAISLGLWNRFGDDTPIAEPARDHPPRVRSRHHPHRPGQQLRPAATARRRCNFGRIMREDLRPYRDELIISTKAGYDMWPGPYGEWGSRKYLLASLDQSLQPHGPRVRRHLLLAPLRPRHAAGGDDRRARHRGPPGQGALRRHLLLLRRAHEGGGRDRPRARHADPDPPAVATRC